jgi:hypothetical protein
MDPAVSFRTWIPIVTCHIDPAGFFRTQFEPAGFPRKLLTVLESQMEPASSLRMLVLAAV